MRKLYFSVLAIFLATQLNAQTYCTPTADCSFDDYINNFTFNTISNLNSAGSNCTTGGYILSSLTTTVNKGSSYALSLSCNPSWTQGFGIWIDYNADGDFQDAGEFAYNSGSAGLSFTGSITIPTTAMVGNTRMRVRCQFGNVFNANQSCLNLQYGETEDYIITIQSASTIPVANFSANTTNTCSGTIIFSDLTTGNPTSWLWNFGDNTTSTAQNPTHTYSAAGTYTVTLTATNALGNDVETKTNYITVTSGNSPIAASCTPITTNYFNGFGINNVTFANINNSSANGSAGYQDFSCVTANLVQGQSYSISVNTSTPSQHNVRAWIDFNNNGQFGTNELVFASDSAYIHAGTVAVPTITATNTPLRMRISADYFLSTIPTSCANVTYGQVEDYGVIIVPNTNPPIANFTVSDTLTCDGTVEFTDASQNVPQYYFWDFGDGFTSTLINPTHTYTSDGYYTVSHIVFNSYGSDTMTVTNQIHVTSGNLLGAACIPTTTAYCCQYGITQVQFADILNNTGDAQDGYQDYSCTYTANVNAGTSYAVTVRTGNLNPEDVKIWIDLNNNNVFDATNELVFSSNNKYNHTGTITIPATALTNTRLRMRVMGGSVGNGYGPCSANIFSQAEDYSILVTPVLPVADFIADSTTICGGTVQFTDLSTGAPSSWAWDFGDGTTSNLQNPSHTYATTGTYTVSLNATNSQGNDLMTKASYIVYDLNACNPTLIPQTGTSGPMTACSGLLFDTGGDANNYPNNCTGSILLAPTGAGMVTLTFESFNYQDGFDFLNIYDGNSTSATLIGSYTGTNLPNGGIVSSTGGAMTVEQVTNNFGTRAGFKATWQCSAGPAPTANFSIDDPTTCSGFITLTDLSTGNPTAWSWDFGDGATSTLQNPTHQYTSPGAYTVKLTASNSNGNNTATQINAVVISPSNICMPLSGEGLTITECNSILSDNGGAGNYKSNTNSFVSIIPTGATSIDMFVSVFALENVNDYVKLYDGPDTNSTLLGTYSGTSLVGSIVNFSSGAATIYHYSNGSVNLDGFEFSFTCSTIPAAPTAFFTADSLEVCKGTVKFIDQSTKNPTSWLWNFGDGTTSNLQNPTHTYTSEGFYSVQLKATNSNGSDSLYKAEFINYSTELCVTGVETLVNTEIYFNIFPNPANENFSISFKTLESGTVNIQLFDMLGKLVRVETIIGDTTDQTVILDSSDLQEGVYLIQISNGKINASKRIIITH